MEQKRHDTTLPSPPPTFNLPALLAPLSEERKGIHQGMAGQELIIANLHFKSTKVVVSLVIKSFYG